MANLLSSIRSYFAPTQVPVSVVPKQTKTVIQRSHIPAASISYAQGRGIFASANLDLQQNLDRTRDLSRHLCATDPFLQRYIEVISVYVVGQDGLRIEPSITDARGRLAERVNTSIKEAWDDWSHEATYDCKMSFNEVEQMVVRSVARDGEALIRTITGKSVNKYGFALQVLDPILLDITYSTVLTDGVIIMGIEFDNRGKPRAYHIWNRLPSDINMMPRVRERIPMEEILHIYDNDLPGAVRAMPWTTSVLNTVSRLNQYLEVHLQACSIAATTPLVMTNEEPDVVGVDDVSVSGVNPQQFSQPHINLAYSQILELDHGKRLQSLNLQFPTQHFQETTKQYLQSIASGLFVSYATLTADPASGNSANIRFSSIVEREHFTQLQRWLIKNLHTKVYKAWIESALLYSAIKLPTINPEDYFKVTFRNTRHSTIDPSKDMKSYVEGINNGLYTRTQICSEMGSDFFENVKQLAAEQEYMQKYNVVLGDQQEILVEQPPQ